MWLTNLNEKTICAFIHFKNHLNQPSLEYSTALASNRALSILWRCIIWCWVSVCWCETLEWNGGRWWWWWWLIRVGGRRDPWRVVLCIICHHFGANNHQHLDHLYLAFFFFFLFYFIIIGHLFPKNSKYWYLKSTWQELRKLNPLRLKAKFSK